MEHCVVMCRSLTYAQRAVRVLGQEGISAYMTRAPKGITPEGCSYGVKIRAMALERALEILKRWDIRAGRIYIIRADGQAEEVAR